ncbi:MAG: hypothetical protein U0797_05870 [Gemmataceae bacterium]
MLRVRRTRPHLDSLEGRYAPATIRLIGGNLYISNNTGNLTVTATATNTFTVQDGLKAVTGLKAGHGVFITSSNRKVETVTFDVADQLFTGNLFVNSRNGNDTVNLNGAAGGAINGNVTLLTGLGDDTVHNPQAGALTIRGSLTITDPAGVDSLDMFNSVNGSDLLGGNLTVVGYNAITIGGGADTIRGSINLSTPSDGQTVTVVLGDGLAVGKNVTVLGGGQNDSFNLGAVNISGDLAVNFGGGAQNDFDLATSAGGATVAGNTSLSSSSPSGTLTNNSGPFTTAGNFRVALGDGNYLLMLGAGGLVNVAGDFTLTAGNGDMAAGFLLGNVGGNVNVTFGNGDNDFQVFNAPGGTVNWLSGNGRNRLVLGTGLGSGGSFVVNARFGSGDDELVLDTGATDTLSGVIDFGGDSGAGDTLTVNSGLLSPDLVIVGLP